MNSGIFPAGNRVLVKPDEIETTTESGIIIAQTIADQHAYAQSIGTLVAVGPDAFQEYTTKTERFLDNKWVPFERATTGYSEAFAKVGDRIVFAKYNGQEFIGEDGETYKLMNDTDITARASDKVDFTDLHARKRVGER